MIGKLLCFLGMHRWMGVVIMDKDPVIEGALISTHQVVVCRRCALYGGNIPMGMPPVPIPRVMERGEKREEYKER